LTLPDILRPLAEWPETSAVLLDFDGTLSEIVDRPEDAVPAPGAAEAVAGLVGRYALVAVISGRPTEVVAPLVGVEGVLYAGLYGLEAEGMVPSHLIDRVHNLAAAVPGALVEAKGGLVAVHYRQAPDPGAARQGLAEVLALVAEDADMEVIEGKMVVELVPKGLPRKGGVVEGMIREAGAKAALYAGDDRADLEAFAALDELAGGDMTTVKVAVRGPETPQELVDAADLAVDGPSGLVALLRDLAS